jgi:hypothetical protein
VTLIGPTLLSIFGVPRIEVDQRNLLFWFVELPLTGLWLVVLIAYLISRLNDGWDEEARERRAAARRVRT